MSNKQFKIQIPTQIVRSSKFTSGEFILLAKLIQAYYSQPGDKKLTFKVDHRAIMYYLFLEDNKTFKKHLEGLCEKKIITNEIKSLPRKSGLVITLNELVIPELNKKRGFFTQLPANVLNREVIQVAGHVGVRMLYYYKSYINAKDWSKQYCFVAEETAAEDLGITVKTIIKYNKLLETWKFLKIYKHEVDHGYGDNKHGQEQLLFTKYNNHYFLRQDEIDKFCEEHRSNLTQNA